MKNKLHVFLLVVVFALAFFLRFYRLGEVPAGLYQDETAIGYNAYSLIKTGRDEYGKKLPLYFKSFGDYKLPVYIYATVPSVKLFGLTPFAVRFPSALFGFLTVVAFYFFLKEIAKDERVSLVTSFLLAINPWHLHYSRATFEVSISLFLFVLGSLFLHRYFNRSQRGSFLLGTVCFILALYSYNLTRLLAPFLFIICVYFFRKNNKQLKQKESVLVYLLGFLLLTPFFKTLFGGGGLGSASGTLIFSSAAITAPLLELRSYLAGIPQFFVKIFFNTTLLTLWQYVQNIASYVSVNFLFLTGSTHGNHGIGNVGQLYLFELPLVVIGIFESLQKTNRKSFFLVWAAGVILVASLTREAPHATRSFFLLVPLELFSAIGLLKILDVIKHFKKSFTRRLLFISLGVLVVFNLVYYFTSYYVRFPVLYAKSWRLEDKELSLFIQQNQNKYDTIVFDESAGFIYSSFLFYTAYPPSEFQKTVKRAPDDSEGFSKVLSFGKYEFRQIDPAKDYKKKRTLFITSENKRPRDIPISRAFYYPVRPVVLSVGQTIVQYPVQDIAYEVVEQK